MTTNGVKRDGAHVFGHRAVRGDRRRLSEAVFRGLMAANSSTANPIAQGPWASTFSRFDLVSPFGGQGHGSACSPETLERQCGYATEAQLDDPTWNRRIYERSGLAARCVNIWADECWSVHPQVYQKDKPGDTPFDKKVAELNVSTLSYHYLHSVDRLSGVNRFGVLFMGLDDGGPLDRPPKWIDGTTGKPRAGRQPNYELLYLTPLDESLVRVLSTVEDVNDRRFGQPEFYSLNFSDLSGAEAFPLDPNADTGKVHWTRVLHVPNENAMTSKVFGRSRLKKVHDYLHDVRKVAGGSGEMFRLGGFPGYSFEAFPDALGEADDDLDDDEIREQIEAYTSGYQRYLATTGGKWTSLSPQVANPDKHLAWFLKLICISLGVPLRVFEGSEQGKLASVQDDDTWRTRLSGRQVNHVEPVILRPFIGRMMDFGCLPTVDSYMVAWRDLKSMSDKEKADVSLKKIQAVMQYVSGQCDQQLPPRIFWTQVMGMTEAEAQVISEELKKNPPKPPVVAGTGSAAGGGRMGKAFGKPAGRPSTAQGGDGSGARVPQPSANADASQ